MGNVRRRTKTPSFGEEAGYEYVTDNAMSRYEYYFMLIIVVLAAVALLFSIMGWHEARQGSDFAYNGEAGIFRLEARELARQTCAPFYIAIGLTNPQASSLISYFINTNLSPEDHLALCLFLADPPPPPTPAPTPSPSPSPSPSPMISQDQIEIEEIVEEEMQLPEELCAYFAGFNFKSICDRDFEGYIIDAICSCAPEPEMVIV
jgi:hypothetical protein